MAEDPRGARTGVAAAQCGHTTYCVPAEDGAAAVKGEPQ